MRRWIDRIGYTYCLHLQVTVSLLTLLLYCAWVEGELGLDWLYLGDLFDLN